MKQSNVILSMTNVSKSFPGVQALDQAQIEIEAGEVHVLLGENGAGKSTLMKVLCGQYQPDHGQILLNGELIAPKSPSDAAASGLVMIHQELNLVNHLSVAANIFLGAEPQTGRLLDEKTMNEKAKDLLARLLCTISPETLVSELSVAQKQLVEIAKALRQDAHVLVMDEPTAALSEEEANALFGVIGKLTQSGVAIVYISHRMEEIFKISDRITVMRDGTYVGTLITKESSVDELILMMVGRRISNQFPKQDIELGSERLRVCGLSRHGVISPFDLNVRKGEIVGIGGLMGSGRTELVRAIFGADKTDQGKVFLDERELTDRTPAGSIQAGIGFITEDRKEQGLVLLRSVDENISLASLDQTVLGKSKVLLDLKKEGYRNKSLIQALRVRISSPQQTTGNLSGGNQQKVVIAKWLAANCKVLIFDEPTRGIDVGAKSEIYQLMGDLAKQGVAILFISSEMPELLGLADRIAVMHEGKLQGILPREIASSEKVMSLALGRPIP